MPGLNPSPSPASASAPLFFLGIDVSKVKVDASLLSADGKPKARTFPNTNTGFEQMLAWLSQNLVPVDRIHAGLEATNVYSDPLASQGREGARFLYEQGATASLLNPSVTTSHSKKSLSRNKTDKTDKADVAGIARYLKAFQPAAWTPPAVETVFLQALARRREALVNMRTMELNRLDSAEFTNELSQEPAQDQASARVAASIKAVIALLEEQIATIEHEIHDYIDKSPLLKERRDLLDSIPGIGTITAVTLLSELPDISQFSGAPALAAYAGLTPRRHESGSSVRGRSKLSKIGSPRLRKALYFPAVSALSSNPFVAALKERLLARGLCKMAIIGAAMRKLIHIVFGVLKSGKPFDPTHGLNDSLAPIAAK